MTDSADPIAQPDLAYLDPGDGRCIAIRHRRAADSAATLLFLPGYASDMEGTKAVAVDRFAAERGLGCVRIDYSGTGSSGGELGDGTLDRWLDEVVAAIDLLLPDGPVVIVGSSMGGWLGLHAAMRRPGRVAGLIGLAAAPDFTDWGFDPHQRAMLVELGRIEQPSDDGGPPQVVHRSLWQSGVALRLLSSPIAVDCPVRLVHGDADGVVPIGVPFKLVELIRSGDVQLRLIKGAGHRLSDPRALAAMIGELESMLENIP